MGHLLFNLHEFGNHFGVHLLDVDLCLVQMVKNILDDILEGLESISVSLKNFIQIEWTVLVPATQVGLDGLLL